MVSLSAANPKQLRQMSPIAACQVQKDHQEQLRKGRAVLRKTGRKAPIAMAYLTSCLAAIIGQTMLFLGCSATHPKRVAGLAASNAAQEMNDDLVAAEAAQTALDVDINQLQVQSGCNVT